ncbi:hypothetical protein [Nocardiopsis nanhaiensis]
MSTLPSTPTAGASVEPDTGHVMMWARPAGALAHLIPLTPTTARQLADQLTTAADLADQIAGEGERA